MNFITSTIKGYVGEQAHGGYSLSRTQQTLSDALKGYERIWSMEVKGTGKVNRSEDMTRNKRRAQRLVGKSTWFAKSKSSHTGQAKPTLASRSIKRSRVPDKIESVMFIPYNPQSVLKKQLQETEKAINGWSKIGIIRMIERSGQLLYNKQP